MKSASFTNSALDEWSKDGKFSKEELKIANKYLKLSGGTMSGNITMGSSSGIVYTANPVQFLRWTTSTTDNNSTVAILSIFGRVECSHGVQFLIPILSVTPCHNNCS